MVLGNLNTNKPPEETRRDIEDVFRKWGIDEYRIPRNGGKGESGPATVHYWLNDQKQDLSCSRFHYYRENLRALYMILNALRLAQERGILRELARAAAALLGPGEPQKRPAHEILGVYPDAPVEVAEAAYKALARLRHPDHGGTEEEMKMLNDAIARFRQERAA